MLPTTHTLLLLLLSLAVRRSVQLCAPDCTGTDPETFVRDPTDCTRYYVCINVNGVNTPSEVPLQCTDGYYFNDAHSIPRCDPIEGAPAGFCSRLCDPCIPDCNGNNPGTEQPNPTDCSKFVVCLTDPNVYLENDCDVATPYYDFKHSICQSDETLCYPYCDICEPHCTYSGQRVIDPTDCHQFYLCSPPNKSVFLCPQEQVFNTVTGECEDGAVCETLCPN
ncbi:uncharacterized protein [Procambarus clarkii]|uniref:uncharacterized protein isoform X1 n=1 Tax=Procambarus clarkii TaxID=6728 RepID=UPI003743B36C